MWLLYSHKNVAVVLDAPKAGMHIIKGFQEK